MKILLLNPHVSSEHEIGRALGAQGLAVLYAADTEEAWKLLQLHGKSVELAIIHREGRNGVNSDEGLALIRRMKGDPAQADLPFVITSGIWDDARFAEHQSGPEGANAYLRWPFSEGQLNELLDSLFPSRAEQSPAQLLAMPSFGQPPRPPAAAESSTTSSALILEDASNLFKLPSRPRTTADGSIALDAPELPAENPATRILSGESPGAADGREPALEPADFELPLLEPAPSVPESQDAEPALAVSFEFPAPAAAPEPAAVAEPAADPVAVPPTAPSAVSIPVPPPFEPSLKLGPELGAGPSLSNEADTPSGVDLGELRVEDSGSVLMPGFEAAPGIDADAEPMVESSAEFIPPEDSVQVNEEDLAAEMPYLFQSGDVSKPAPNPALAFTQPVGDAVVPGGAAQSPDMETLKKYLLLREQDVAVLSSQLRAAQEQVAELEAQLKSERSSNEDLQRRVEEQRKQATDLEKEKNLALEALHAEIADLRFQIKAKADKVRLMEVQVREAATEIEHVKDRVRADIRKIRVREKELENRLEITRKDSEALIAARESKILELKRKIDLLEFNMDLLQNQYSREKETSAKLREKLARAAQVVRVAGGLLDGAPPAATPDAAPEAVPAADEREKAS